MTSEQQERLFKFFSQADNSTTRKFGGSGLGLALSRRLAKALGGDVVVEKSIPNHGAVFAITVEAEKATGNMPMDSDASQRAEAAKKVTKESISILVAEDSPDNQYLLKHLLGREGFKVDVANNGEEAVQMAKNNDTYDLIIMDMQMPVMDGYNATRTLRSSGYNKPIIALTAHAMNEERARILEAGCDEHLTKPLNSKLLISTIISLSKK